MCGRPAGLDDGVEAPRSSRSPVAHRRFAMDALLFDRWTVALALRPTRRTATRLLVGGLVSGLLVERRAQSTRAQASCVQIGEVCDAAPCCIGECMTRMDDAPSICLCAADGEECYSGIGTGACCSGQPCNANGFCGTCTLFGGTCNSDAECCSGGQYGAALCCFDGVSMSSRCTDVTNIGFVCPGDSPAPTSCPAGQTLCTISTTFCTDLASDPFNCGACAYSCGLGGVCRGGVCNPAPAPIVDSDGDGVSDDDEVAMGTDPFTPDEAEPPEDVPEPDAPPEALPAPDVLHGDNGLPAESGGGGAGGGDMPGHPNDDAPCA